MKIAVIGSRGFSHKILMYNVLDNIRLHVPSCEKIECIVSGGAIGADKTAEEYASARNIPLEIYLPDYAQYGRAAPLKRNILIVERADLIVAFWDGKSRGTKQALTEATRQNKLILKIDI